MGWGSPRVEEGVRRVRAEEEGSGRGGGGGGVDFAVVDAAGELGEGDRRLQIQLNDVLTLLLVALTGEDSEGREGQGRRRGGEQSG